MKVLLDECVPKRFARRLPGHDVKTVPEAGWAGIKNGALLERASSIFGAFVTVDRNLAFQQNLQGLPIPVIVIHCRTNKLRDLEPYAPTLLTLLASGLDRSLHHVRLD